MSMAYFLKTECNVSDEPSPKFVSSAEPTRYMSILIVLQSSFRSMRLVALPYLDIRSVYYSVRAADAAKNDVVRRGKSSKLITFDLIFAPRASKFQAAITACSTYARLYIRNKFTP